MTSAASSVDMQSARAKAQRLLAKYPGSVPVVCRNSPDSDLPRMDKKQFLVPRSMLCDEFKDIVRKHIKDTVGVSLASAQAICLSVHGMVLNGRSSMSELYEQHKADDLLLHMDFCVGGQSDSSEVPRQVASKSRAGTEAQTRTEIKDKPSEVTEAPMSAEARRIFAKHPNSIPVVCERASGSNAPGLIKERFLVPQTMLCSEFTEVVGKNFKEGSMASQGTAAAVCLMLPSGAELEIASPMRVLYDRHRAADGFLYLCYSVKGDGLEATTLSATGQDEEEESASSILPAASTPLSDAAPTLPLEDKSPASPQQADAEKMRTKMAARRQLIEDQQLEEQDTDVQVAQSNGSQEGAQQTMKDSPTDKDCPATKTPNAIHLPDNDVMSEVADVEDSPAKANEHAIASPAAVQKDPVNVTPSATGSLSTGASAGSGIALRASGDGSQDVQKALTVPAETTYFGAKTWASRSTSEEAARMLAKYPDRVPVICRSAPGREAPELRKTKFLVPGKMFCSEFKYLIHQQLRQSGHQGLASDQTIYLFLNNTSPKTCTLMADLYDQHKAEDGYLYFTYSLENTLGSTHELY